MANPVDKLTAEVIEAAFSAHGTALAEAADINKDSELFITLVCSREQLRTEIDDSLKFLVEAESLGDARERLLLLCDIFFWIGWHARGAIEDEDKLSGMLGDEGGGG